MAAFLTLLVEGMALSFLLLLMCVVGIANGPEKFVVFYEKEIKQRAVALGYTTEAEIKKQRVACSALIAFGSFVLLPLMLYYINGARSFGGIFRDYLIASYIKGAFDKAFIDGWWVQKTNAWVIKGTEDLMPYIPRKLYLKKWLISILSYPICGLLVAAVMSALVS